MPGPSDEQVTSFGTPARIGRFEVQSVLGAGNFGRVLLAWDTQIGRKVAIKQPFGEGLRPELLADFLKEARAVAAVDEHPNVVQVYEVGSDDGSLPYIVMRYVVGCTLKDLLARRKSPLTIRNAADVARRIALGLSAAHAKGVIHRDLKPANVLYDEIKRQVLITDFGLARVCADPQSTASLNRGAHGTPTYIPPEQCGTKEFGEISPLADVYSLGVILYEMLSGWVPFIGGTYELLIKHCTEAPIPPSAIRPAVDARIEELCLRALAKHPSDRYPSARAFADELANYLTPSEGVKAPPKPDPAPKSVPTPKAPAPKPPPAPRAAPDPAPNPDLDEIILDDAEPRPRKRGSSGSVGGIGFPSDDADGAQPTGVNRSDETERDLPVEPPAPRVPQRALNEGGLSLWVIVLSFLFFLALGIVLALILDRRFLGKSPPTHPRAEIELFRGDGRAPPQSSPW